MPELPEIAARARQMHAVLVGKLIERIDVIQPKCLNIPVSEFQERLAGAAIQKVSHHGKWLFVETDRGHLLLNLGMGGDLLLTRSEELPEKRRVVFHFSDNTSLTVNFWWFGYAHYVPAGKMEQHEMTARLGPNVLDLTQEEFSDLLRGAKGRVKAFLLDQSKVAGIGNAYIHDILFLAGLHPQRAIASLTDQEIVRLHAAIDRGLSPSMEKGGAFYEKDLYGQPGGFTMEDILIGYREGQPCPHCERPIEKIKTGSTSSFVCLACQPLT